MIYTDLQGNRHEGEVWSLGPIANTVWVVRDDGHAAVVHATKLAEVEYEQPQRLRPPPAEAVKIAKDIEDRYRSVQALFRDMGLTTTPVGPEWEMAQAVLNLNDRAQESRLPYINAHGGKNPVGEAKFKSLKKLDDK